MLFIWWPAFIVPVLMVLAGLLGRYIPGFRYRSPNGRLNQERQEFADRQLFHMLWQIGIAFAALVFMVMRSVCLLPETVQKWLLYGAFALEVLGVVLMVLPIERALQAQFEDEKPENKGDHT